MLIFLGIIYEDYEQQSKAKYFEKVGVNKT